MRESGQLLTEWPEVKEKKKQRTEEREREREREREIERDKERDRASGSREREGDLQVKSGCARWLQVWVCGCVWW